MMACRVPPQKSPSHSTRVAPGRAAVMTASSRASEPSGSLAAMNSSTGVSVGRMDVDAVIRRTYARGPTRGKREGPVSAVLTGPSRCAGQEEPGRLQVEVHLELV